MKEVRRIKFTGKNLNDVFLLPCVKRINKIGTMPELVFNHKMMDGFSQLTGEPGDELVEYDNGLWKVIRQPDESPE